MALIRCPECGKSISSEPTACPNCGYPIKSYVQKIVEKKDINDNAVLPLNPAWLDKYKSKPATYKMILTIIFLVNLVLVIGFFVGKLYLLGAISSFFLIFTSSFCLAAFISIKTKIIEENGYHAIAVSGVFRNCLVVENVVQEIGHNRHLDGKFPNGKHVWADFAFWDGNIKISVSAIPFNTPHQ